MTDTYDETEHDAPRAMTLPELRKFQGQLFISNKTPLKITFHEQLGDGRVDFELDPAGEPDSIAFLPKLALDMRGLQKLWLRGSVAISDDPQMEEEIMLLNAKAVGASEQRMREIMNTQGESANNRDITEAQCLVCGQRDPRTNVVTRGRVLQSRRQVKEGIPPLCTEHLGQASQFIPRLVADSNGDEHWEFSSIQMTTTQR